MDPRRTTTKTYTQPRPSASPRNISSSTQALARGRLTQCRVHEHCGAGAGHLERHRVARLVAGDNIGQSIHASDAVMIYMSNHIAGM